MSRPLVSADELQGQLRLRGIDDIAAVRRAVIEPDGRLGVITHDPARPSAADCSAD